MVEILTITKEGLLKEIIAGMVRDKGKVARASIVVDSIYGSLVRIEIHKGRNDDSAIIAIRYLENTYPQEVDRLREFIYLKFRRIPFFKDGAFWLKVSLDDLTDILTQICLKFFGWRKNYEIVVSLYLEGVGTFFYVTNEEGRVLKEFFKKGIVSIEVKRTFMKSYIEFKLADGTKRSIPLSNRQAAKLEKKLNLPYYCSTC